MSDLTFEDFHSPAREHGCLLKGRLPDKGVVLFAIRPIILADVLGARSGMSGDRALAHCEQHREQIEYACRRAYASRPSSRVDLEVSDFRRVEKVKSA